MDSRCGWRRPAPDVSSGHERGSAAMTGAAIAALFLLMATANAKPPQIMTTSLPQGTAGTAYSAQLAAKDGDPPDRWSITPGSLPRGIMLSATSGALSGTPTTPGTSPFTATVTDNSSQTDSQALSIVINAAPLTVTTSSLPNGTAGSAYSQTLSANGGSGG